MYLGLKKNSSRRADWGVFELKTTTLGQNSKISLFNITVRYQNQYSARDLVCEFGKVHHSKHLNKPVIRLDWEISHSKFPIDSLYYNISPEEGPLTLNYGERTIAYTDRNKLEKWFRRKFKNLVLIFVDSLIEKNNHGFIIKKAFLLETTSFSNFLRLMHEGEIKLSFKMMLVLPNTVNETLKNRGIGFKTTYKTLTKLYGSKKNLI